MASRSKPERRSERGNDTMEAIKPLIVLGLFGTILYGAYSVVQKGPSHDAGQAATSEAPAFAPPEVEVSQQAASPAAVAAPAAAPLAGPEPVGPPPVLPAAPPAAMVNAPPPAAPPAATPVPPAAVVAAAPVTPPAVPAPPAPTAPPSAAGGLTEATVSAAAVAGLAAGAAAATAAAPTPPAAAPPGAPTYLAAESAPPPAQEDVAVATGDGGERPERLAALAPPSASSLLPEMPPPPGSLPSSAAFATAWTDAHDKLSAGRYAEALTALSVWYDDPSLGLEESHRLEDLLGQLAGTVIYSQQDLLLPPHVVAAGETLPAIAAQLGVSWQLLAKINGVSDPMQLVPGEHLKVIRGPFDAVVSVARRRISLQVGGAYAGSFPVSVGREFLPRVGSAVPVAEVRRDPAAQAPAGPAAAAAILLADGLSIQAADDPAVVAADAAPASLVVSVRDLTELLDILGPGSRVLIRQ
jgi:hypothetical protein